MMSPFAWHQNSALTFLSSSIDQYFDVKLYSDLSGLHQRPLQLLTCWTASSSNSTSIRQNASISVASCLKSNLNFAEGDQLIHQLHNWNKCDGQATMVELTRKKSAKSKNVPKIFPVVLVLLRNSNVQCLRHSGKHIKSVLIYGQHQCILQRQKKIPMIQFSYYNQVIHYKNEGTYPSNSIEIFKTEEDQCPPPYLTPINAVYQFCRKRHYKRTK